MGRGGHHAGTIERLDPLTETVTTLQATDWPIYDLAVVSDCVLATMGLVLRNVYDSGPGVFGAGGGGMVVTDMVTAAAVTAAAIEHCLPPPPA